MLNKIVWNGMTIECETGTKFTLSCNGETRTFQFEKIIDVSPSSKTIGQILNDYKEEDWTRPVRLYGITKANAHTTGNFIPAIKLVRYVSAHGLGEAKSVVENYYHFVVERDCIEYFKKECRLLDLQYRFV